jgi:tetratricopeptide (TPR) repeat protein
MGGFGEEARSMLQWAAVLTPRINLHCLERVTNLPLETIDEALQQAEEQGVLHPGERGMRFAHELIRNSVYESISPARRRAMHRRVAELLEKDASVDLDKAVDLSHHARRSEDPYMAAKAMVSAGKLCLRFYANDDAMALYREGMAFATQLTEAQRVCLSLELGEIRMNARQVEDWQGLVDEFVALAEQAMDHGSRAHARLGYQMASYLRWIHGEMRGAKRFSMQAERLSRGASDEAQIMGLAEAAKCLALLDRDLSRAEAMIMEANSLAQRVGYDCPAIPTTLGILRYHGDQFEEAVDHLEDARAMAKTSGDRLTEYMANEYLTIVEMERRDCVAAREYANSLVDIGARIREGSERPFAESLQAVCRFGLSGDDTGLGEALVELRHADAKQRLAFVLNRAAIQYIEHQQLQRGQECAAEALELARVMDRTSETLQALLSLERIHRMDVQLEPVSHLDQIEEIAADGVSGWVRRRLDELLVQQE